MSHRIKFSSKIENAGGKSPDKKDNKRALPRTFTDTEIHPAACTNKMKNKYKLISLKCNQ